LTDLRYGGNRLAHGAPSQFIWVADDGEIRIAGRQLDRGLIASMKDAKIAAAHRPHFSPISIPASRRRHQSRHGRDFLL
jgi:hypothetical protein